MTEYLIEDLDLCLKYAESKKRAKLITFNSEGFRSFTKNTKEPAIFSNEECVYKYKGIPIALNPGQKELFRLKIGEN